MSNQRFDAIKLIDQRQVRKFDLPQDERGNELKVSEYFGANTFNLLSQKDKLPKDVFQKLQATVHTGKKLDADVANTIAHLIKEWAIEHGVTHFCHWFQPQTGSTAEKHDAFLTIEDGKPFEKFSGSQLIQSEPDASSFPSGGMRTTFEARGYTAWDPSSPIFIMESTNGKTMCIPSVFISYHGDALDEKAPLLRSMEVLNKNALELLHTIGEKNAKRVVPTVGVEQEYFLVDRAFFNLRPDLVMSGRTLVGGQPPRGQQLEDHYFGSIPPRVLAYMQEVEFELYKLGMPAKTRHNEVAPMQFEMAPIFEEANVAADHNQLAMEVMRRVATRHGFANILHEKPFAGVNGSGKHNNWSMAVTTDHGEENLLEPGKTPHENLRFLLMLAATMKGVMRHSGLMRAAIAYPGNDHRLGANEAPPAIISVFLGQQLNDICNKIEAGTNIEQNPEAAVISLGVSKIPSVSKDNTDRNRTSPFAFTGNKFEFRAVGSSMPISFPMTVVNAAVAEAIGEVTESLKKRVKAGKKLDVAILEVVKETIVETRNVRFEGNNYSDDWVREAERRGLPNLKRAPEAIEQVLTPASKKLFTGLNILSDAEIHSRHHVMLERYVKKLSIEGEMLASMIDTMIVPAVLKEQTATATAIRAITEVARSTDVSEQTARLTAVTQGLNELLTKRKDLTAHLARVGKLEHETDKAHALANEVLPLMNQIRAVSDRLEDVVSDEYWTLPKYREMLFLA
ncbi:MAG: glutamine synthetase III [Deltaproteobacteria bacterium]|nr:glutamine synthetase III [Deltaproteobacteria bacterium]